MESYNKNIKDNADVEFIHISLEDEDAAEKWAKKAQFSWPTVREEDMKKAGVGKVKYAIKSYPSYLVVDKDGNVDPGGRTKAFQLLGGQ